MLKCLMRIRDDSEAQIWRLKTVLELSLVWFNLSEVLNSLDDELFWIRVVLEHLVSLFAHVYHGK